MMTGVRCRTERRRVRKVATEQNVRAVLRAIVQGCVALPDVALMRIWLRRSATR